jgi:hypothetical protein
LSRQPSKEFLRFAEVSITNMKADPKHNHSFNSYLLRIPHTFNSKCINKNADPEVKIIQRFDRQNIPQINTSLLREFRLYLADIDIKNKTAIIRQEQKCRWYNKSNNHRFTTYEIPQSCQWIKAPIQTPIPDHRKITIDLVLAPYLINIIHLSFNQAWFILRDWVLKCNTFRALKPSINNFLNYRVKVAIDRSTKNHIPPIKKETIKKNYPEWYRDFEEWSLFS